MEKSKAVFDQLITTIKNEAKAASMDELLDLFAWQGCKDSDTEAAKAWERMKCILGVEDAGLALFHLFAAAIKAGDIDVYDDPCYACDPDGEMTIHDFKEEDPTWAGTDRLALGKVLIMLRGFP